MNEIIKFRLENALLHNEVGREPSTFAKAFDVLHGSAPENRTYSLSQI